MRLPVVQLPRDALEFLQVTRSMGESNGLTVGRSHVVRDYLRASLFLMHGASDAKTEFRWFQH